MSPADGLFVAGPSGGNYYAAVAYCTSIGGEIAVIRSAEENELAQKACGGQAEKDCGPFRLKLLAGKRKDWAEVRCTFMNIF